MALKLAQIFSHQNIRRNAALLSFFVALYFILNIGNSLFESGLITNSL
jgi:hypothetical protein